MASDEDISGSDGASPLVIAPLRLSFPGKSSPERAGVLLSSAANTDGIGPINAGGNIMASNEKISGFVGACPPAIAQSCNENID